MIILRKYMLFAAVVMIVLPIILSTISSDKITATDWVYRHTAWIDRYLHGDFTPIMEYPPIFHWFMLPFVAMNLPMQYFQIVFIVAGTLSMLYMAYKLEGENRMLLLSFLLASSVAYVSFAGSLMPQATDYIIFPLIVLAYFNDKRKLAFIGLLILNFSHASGVLLSLVLILHAIFTRTSRECSREDEYQSRIGILPYLLIPLLLVTPLYLIEFILPHFMFVYPPPSYIWDSVAQIEWDKQFYDPIWKFFGLSGFLTWILLPYASFKLWKNKLKLTDTQLFYVLWIGSFIPLAISSMGYWRMISFQIIPLSLLVASLIVEKEDNFT